MGIHFITSGWPNGFTAVFSEQLKRYLCPQNDFVYIASDFAGHKQTQYYFSQTIQQFAKWGIVFERSAIIDDRITLEQAQEWIRKAGVILLAGGPTLKQMASIQEYRLEKELQNTSAIVIGISAGAINMAKRVVLAKDESDDIPQLSIYPGIGLTEINIEPHLGSADPAHIQDIHEAARHAPIYGLYDESFIVEDHGMRQFFGPYEVFDQR